MPATSKKQQRFMGMVHAVQKGDMKAPSPEVAATAKNMKEQDVTDFAETKHKGLPEKKEAAVSALSTVFGFMAKQADLNAVMQAARPYAPSLIGGALGGLGGYLAGDSEEEGGSPLLRTLAGAGLGAGAGYGLQQMLPQDTKNNIKSLVKSVPGRAQRAATGLKNTVAPAAARAGQAVQGAGQAVADKARQGVGAVKKMVGGAPKPKMDPATAAKAQAAAGKMNPVNTLMETLGLTPERMLALKQQMAQGQAVNDRFAGAQKFQGQQEAARQAKLQAAADALLQKRVESLKAERDYKEKGLVGKGLQLAGEGAGAVKDTVVGTAGEAADLGKRTVLEAGNKVKEVGSDVAEAGGKAIDAGGKALETAGKTVDEAVKPVADARNAGVDTLADLLGYKQESGPSDKALEDKARAEMGAKKPAPKKPEAKKPEAKKPEGKKDSVRKEENED
jgi:hypothetical protein